MEKLKAKGLDFTICGITFIVTVLSYAMTIEILSSSNIASASDQIANSLQVANQSNTAITEATALNFLRSSFVFLSPCALEGINLFCSKVTKKLYLDVVEVIISVISILVSIYLFLFAFRGTTPTNLQWIPYALLIYPIKFGVNLFSEFFELVKLRRS